MPPVLTSRALNRALLARQLLLERAELPLDEAVERVAGLQDQYAPSGYLALWSRVRGFRRAELTAALEDRRVVQATLMRATIHIVSRRDCGLFTAAVRRTRREWWERVQKKALRGVDMEAVAERVRQHLAEGPLRARELQARLEAEGYPRIAAVSAGMWVDLVRVPPTGTWERRRADLYGLADEWLGAAEVSEQEGIEHLVRRYLRGFGPATLEDVASFTGLPKPLLRVALEGIAIRCFRDEAGGELLDVSDAPLPAADTPAPVRFLPTWDATLLVHARRTQILPEAYRPRIFHTKAPHSFATFLVDGAVAGTWRYERGRVELEPFEALPDAVRGELEAEAAALAAFHA